MYCFLPSMNTALRLSIVTLIVFCGPGPGLAAQADTLQRKPKQIVAVYHCDYPPVSFLNKNTDNADGFFVDIMNSVAERAGLRATYICKSGWPEMMHAIQSGEADLGALMKSEEREKKLAFSSPIDTSYLSFFARSQSSIDPDRLPAGCTVGVIKGSMSFEQLKKKPGLRLQTEDSYQEGIFSLLAGEISLFAGEESMILKRARETKLDDRIRKTGKAFLERERGLAVRKDNAELVALLNKALDGFIGSQEYQTIYLKWYGVPTPYWTVNKILIVCGSFLLTAVSGMAVWRFRSLAMINRELVRNITERKKAERSLEQSKAFNAKILETVDEGFIVIDAQFKILSANNAYLSQVKLPLQEVLGKKCHEISHHLSVPCHEAGEDCSASLTFASGNPHIAVHRHQNTKGGLVMVEIKSYPVKDGSGKVISVIEVVNNITDKINLEAQVSHSQKLEAVGHLAGGIAHDFNNILTAIIGYGSLAKRKMKKDDPAIHDLQQILESADRAANLTRGLLAFSRKQIISPRPVNVNDIVKNIEKLIMRLIGEDIVPQIILTNRKATVLADSGQIEQILMNLTTNARDAMPEGGSLIVRTETAALGDDFIRAHGYGKPGMYVLLSVQDSGRGMDGKTKESIFEPFFTTKEVGRGTGLGLSIVYGIVKQHNGYIECDTELGKGTTFKIYLPMIRGDFEAKDDKIQPVVRGGTETVLVAEDDHAVRSLIKEILTLHGYSVIEAANGEDAIAKFKEHSDSVHALLLDVLMPGKSGKDVYDEIRGAGHDVKAIFMSGYTADVIHKKGILDGELAFIAKPVTPSELLSKLRDALGAGQAV